MTGFRLVLRRIIAVLPLIFFSICSHAQVGKDGAKIINTTNTIVNDYTFLITDANAGNTSIIVNSNVLSTGFTAPLAAGDLVFIIQVQGAFITTPDDSTYGEIPFYLNAGNYEFAQVQSISGGNTIRLSCGLQYSYNVQGRTQVIRVPRYSTLTLLANQSITAPVWNGATGGIVVLEVQGQTIINTGASIDVSAKGFRPGLLPENLSFFGVLNWVSPLQDYGAEKGEGIGGSVGDYDAAGGRYGKGAPANGGGGGNGHNAGGGGGANAGTGTWNGRGVPDPAYPAAWNLEYPGFAGSASPGGGKGGYTMGSSNQDALTVGPFNTLWGGDYRRDNGGRGGRVLDYSTGRIFMGGGGGAGDMNSNVGGIGGYGGGLIYIYSYADISGNGTIRANGQNGGNSGVDGAGGGGAGGTIIINSTSTISGVTLSANGGNGGSQTVGLFSTESEGPGGGGGGGYIAVSSGTPTRTATGGVNGTTNSFAVTEFPPNGATRGGDGISNAGINAFRIITSPISTCYGVSETLSFTAQGTPPTGITYNWYNAAVGGSLLGTGTTFTTPPLTANVTYYVGTCPGFARFPIQITVDQVSGSFTSTSVCAGNPTTFVATGSSTLGSVISYNWDFGNGVGVGSGASTSYTYPLGGTYPATLIITDTRGCRDTITNNVTVYTSPVISFSTTASGGCSGLNVGFINNTTGGTSYTWNFGDGVGTSTATNPTYTYAGAGTYTVSLSSTNPGGCTATVTQSLTVGPRPTASFSYSGTFCQNDTIRFTNLSTPNGSTITSYLWNFGNGQTSTSTNPRYLYPAAGTYNVTLTTFSGTCSDDTIITVNIVAAPVANFSTLQTSGCSPYAVTFTNSSSGTTSFSWTFGDGGTSSSTSPTHTYNNPGTYAVTLIASSPTCPDTLRRTNYITVVPTPTASFAYATTFCLSDTVRFTNASTGNGSTITSYQWNFGDGGTATSANTTHRYTAAGTYSVSLRADNGTCFDDTVISITIVPSPVANFSTTNLSGCSPYAVTFTNTSTGTTSFSWNFGDGNTSTSTAPSHTYTNSGTYTVTLIAASATCPDTLRRTSYIQVSNTPTASFNYSTTFCLNDTVRFTNASAGNGSTITSYLWNFGDGGTANTANTVHRYTTAGTYNVSLRASNASCFDDTVITITIVPSPLANFATTNLNGCVPYSVTFTNSTTGTTSYSWNFGDGNTSTASTPSHTYANSGSYTVTLIALSPTCPDTLVRTNYINVGNVPTASYTVSSTTVCLGDSIRFTDTSNGNGSTITSYNWNFGNGNSSVVRNPAYLYPAAGTYTVTLTVNSSGCTSSSTNVITVQPGPVAAFTASSATTICRGSSVTFSNTTTGATSYSWNFGDGGSAVSANPVYQYNTNGTFTVTLIASSGTCSDTIRRTAYVNVLNGPTASFSTSPTFCIGDTSFFTNSSNGNGTGITGYTWDFGDGTNSSLTNPNHYYSTAGTYVVTLTATNGTCSDDSVFSVNVNVSPVANFSVANTTVCGQTPVTFNNTSTGTPAYTWNFGDGNSSSVTSPSHSYAASGTYTVTLIATQGSCGDTLIRSSYITVVPSPTASFATADVCNGTAVSFTNSSTGNGSTISSYQWNFGDGNTSTGTTPSHTYASTGAFAVTLTAGNGQCSDDTTITVNVFPQPTSAFTSSATLVCLGTSISFTNTSTAGTNYLWSFGDNTTSTSAAPTHTYATAGTYTVTLISTQGVCADTLVRSNYILVNPVPTANFIPTGGCLGDSARFQNLSTGNGAAIVSYGWTFGDGGTSTLASPTHFYSAGGTYTVKLTVNNGGCNHDTSLTVVISNPPTVNYSTSSTTACDSLTVSFTNNSTGAISYNWNFGDGNTSTVANPVHTYLTPGNYSVLLTASSGTGCNASRLRQNLVQIKATPVPSFSASNTSICPGECISFTNSTTGNPTNYTWSFGGASPSLSTGSTPASVCYSRVGNYDVTLTAANGACSASVTQPGYIRVVDCTLLPTASFIASDSTFCAGQCINFRDLSLNATSWNWTFQGATPASSTLQNPENVCYAASGTYTVRLIVANPAGSDTINMQSFIDVSAAPPTPVFTQSGDTLIGPAGAFAYQWYRNNIAISGATNQRHRAMLSGNYTLQVSTSAGCTSTSSALYVSLIGFEDVGVTSGISIYPNPANEFITIQLEELKGNAVVEIYNSIGQKIYLEKISPSSEIRLDISSANFSSGIYVVNVQSAYRTYRTSFLIAR